MSQEFDPLRRRFFGTAAVTIAAAQLGMVDLGNAQSGNADPAHRPMIKPGTHWHAMTEVAEESSFWIDRESLRLWRSHAGGEDESVRLTPKSFDVLRYLAENPGCLYT